jgi:hypothetical protein
MAVIFVGATMPDASWPRLAILPVAAVTGAVGGVLLGLITGLCWPFLHTLPAARFR